MILADAVSRLVACDSTCSAREAMSRHRRPESATRAADLAAEWHPDRNGELRPSDISSGSGRKVWWRCSKRGHEWQARMNARSHGSGCPACARPLYESLARERPDLIDEWDADRNAPLQPSEVTAGSGRRVWWLCRVCGHRWQTRVQSRALNQSGCPACARRRNYAPRLSLAAERPDLAAEWHPDRNGPHTPDTVTCGSSKRKMWWRCSQCGHDWQTAVNKRVRGSGCPVCAGRHQAPLPETHRHLADEWDHTANDVTVADVTAGSVQRASWRCPHGHRWQAQINERAKGRGCPVCAGRYSSSLAVTHPDIAAQWDTDSNGPLPDTLTAGSGRHATWRCPHGHTWTSAVKQRTFGHGCPTCSHLRFVEQARQRGASHPGAKLTDQDVIAIRRDPRTNAELARLYNVHTSNIHAIRYRKSWRHLP